MSPTELKDVSVLTDDEIQRRWEDAYARFETPEQEVRKFIGRLTKLGQSEWQRDAQVVDIFCGRGNGLKALEALGFTNLEGVDISPTLIARYHGPAKMYEADCRKLPFPNNSRDIMIVQGGLHHLPKLPDDLDQTLSEIGRVLRPDGRFVMVEPWLTLFLRMIHFTSEINAVRTISRKFDAFATMNHYEATTYFQWLRSDDLVRQLLSKHFDPTVSYRSFGKIYFIGKKARAAN
jgi:ubiquinone/menaquinone biosynthesis C-methylase UbiE